MSLDIASIPLSYLAGVLSILSPCVWPLVPIVMSSAASKGKWGPLYLALGLSLAFALAGSLLAYVFLQVGLNPDALRIFAAALLLLIGGILIYQPLADWVSLKLSLLSGRLNIGNPESASAMGQFGVGMLLGLVWLPCVGPTLGAAIALASMGQNMVMAFVVMFVFGLGTVSALLVAAFASDRLLNRLQPGMMKNVTYGKKMLGGLLLFLGAMVLTGFDKVLETWALQLLPDWAISL